MDTDIESNSLIAKFVINERNVYVKLLWEDNEDNLFRVKIFDGCNSWSGSFSIEDANTFRNLLDESKDVYKMNVKKAFSDSHEEFIYDFVVLQDDDKKARFSWKKVFDDSTVMAQGTLSVNLDDVAESKDTLIDFLLNENKELRSAIEAFTRQNEALTENLDKCKREMEEFVNMKTQLESSLYGKFVQLLNEKKKRIRLLEENIQKFE